ncbi:MmpS family transport accessory protein [Flavobacterium sp.]|uniref:MmpS family transport accessory protein n=1 Tax=Flavobacterium sp. TaxID=239 RepID=UPI003D0CFB39
MKSILKTLAIVLTLAFTAVSCSSDNDNNSGSTTSRDVKYEITGNYAGKLSVTYLEKSSSALIEDITTLPWTKEFTANADAQAAAVQTSGYGGVKGQTLTAKVYIGGKVVKELTATATEDGIIVLVPGTYVFPIK